MTTLSFDDLKPDVVTARVTTSYGKTIDVPLQLLSWQAWEEIGRDVPEPTVPLTKPAPSGKPEDMLPNPDDKAYLERKANAADERLMRRLLAALEGGGVNVPGESTRERVAALREMDAGLLQALVAILSRAFMGAQARVETRADSFCESAITALENADVPTVGDYATGI